ncbi:PqiC family protein [Acidisoma sp. C75]
MMLSRRQVSFGLLVLAALPAGCASPNPVLYTLDTVPGPVQPNAGRTILLQDIAIAPYLDRKFVVRSSSDFRIAVEQNDWWGEPFAAMLGRVLGAELGQRLPGATVLTESSTLAAKPSATVAINVSRFDEDASGSVVLVAQMEVTFADGRRAPAIQNLRLVAAPAGQGVAAQAAAMSVAWGQFADRLAATIAAS